MADGEVSRIGRITYPLDSCLTFTSISHSFCRPSSTHSLGQVFFSADTVVMWNPSRLSFRTCIILSIYFSFGRSNYGSRLKCNDVYADNPKLYIIIRQIKQSCYMFNYKITKIVRALWLAERSVCMRVWKHGCDVKMFCFSRANHFWTFSSISQSLESTSKRCDSCHAEHCKFSWERKSLGKLMYCNSQNTAGSNSCQFGIWALNWQKCWPKHLIWLHKCFIQLYISWYQESDFHLALFLLNLLTLPLFH